MQQSHSAAMRMMKSYTMVLGASKQQCHLMTVLMEHQCYVLQSRNMTNGSSQLSATSLPNANAQKLAHCVQRQLAQSEQHVRQSMRVTHTRSVGIVLGKDPELYSLVPLKALNFLFDTLFLNHEQLEGIQGWSLVC